MPATLAPKILLACGIALATVACDQQGSAMSSAKSDSSVTPIDLKTICAGEWVLSGWSLGTGARPLAAGSEISFSCLDDGKVAGAASVNRYSGTLEIGANGTLKWPSPGMATTRMAGPPELMDQEQAYLKDLVSTTHMRQDSDHLILENRDQGLALTFIRKP